MIREQNVNENIYMCLGNITLLSNISTTHEIEPSELTENLNDFENSDMPTDMPVSNEEFADGSEGEQLTNVKFQQPEKIAS